MIRDDAEIVSAVQQALVARVGKDRFQVWFGRGVRMEPRGTTLRIAAADAFRLDYLRRAFREDLLAALASNGWSEWTLEFGVAGELAALAPSVTLGAPAPDECAADRDRTPTPAPQREPRRAAVPAPEGIAHRLQRRQFASLADFVVSDANRLAATGARTAAEQPGTYSPLTFVGPAGCGKTHLLEGIWRHVRESRRLSRVIYLSAEQFTNQYLDALRHSGMPNFRRKYRDVECLLVDDLQFFVGKQSTLVELVHTIDNLLRDGRQLVFAIDRPPAELRGLGPELIARLNGGLVCQVELADAATRLGVLKQLARKLELTIPPEALSWLAAQMPGDARQLAGALHRLKASSAAHHRAIDLAFTQDTLQDLIPARAPVRMNEIVDAVSDVFGVSPDDLQSGKKTLSATLPRMLVMFLARKWTRAAHSEISRSLGRRSHSTVVSAEQKVSEWLTTGKTLSIGHRQCRVEDAIKRVEARLKLA